MRVYNVLCIYISEAASYKEIYNVRVCPPVLSPGGVCVLCACRILELHKTFLCVCVRVFVCVCVCVGVCMCVCVRVGGRWWWRTSDKASHAIHNAKIKRKSVTSFNHFRVTSEMHLELINEVNPVCVI